MKRLFLGAALALLGLGAIATLRADDDNDKALHAKLVGTWRMASAKFGGQESDLPQMSVTFKHVTPAGFMWLSHDKDGLITRAAGGTYTLRNGKYTEKIEYGMGDDFEVIKKAKISFTCKVEGDKWNHTGELPNGTTIEEVWERVKPADMPAKDVTSQ
jgi:hypothetical protein